MSRLIAGVVAVVAGCANDDAAPTMSTIAVTSTAYVTIPARTTTSTIAPAPEDQASANDGQPIVLDPPDDPTQERAYEIQSGDYLVGIASDFDVPVNNIVEYNGWGDGLRHPLVPGEEIRIPPSDYDPDGAVATDGTAAADVTDESTADDNSAGECPDGNPQGTYTLRSGDIPARVAQANGTTVAELEAANDGVVGYSGFVVGIEINLPC